MNIEERKKIREKYQSENLLSIISKEMFPKKSPQTKGIKKIDRTLRLGLARKQLE